MPILSPQIDHHHSNPRSQTNTASQILAPTLLTYQIEFKRAYKLIKKVAKSKLSLSSLFNVPPQELY